MAAAAVTAGDVIVKDSVKHDGSFTGYQNSKIVFVNAKGKTVKDHYSRISSITFQKPRSVWVKVKGKKNEEKAVCKGFQKSRFILELNGKPLSLTMDKIASISIAMDDAAGGMGGGAEETEAVDTKALVQSLGGNKPNAAQETALAGYSAARGKYDAFAEKAASVTAEFNNATGAARAAVTDRLREMKHQEQELLRELNGAESALSAAFNTQNLPRVN